MSWFKFKGISSEQYGILESLPLDLRPERVTSVIEIPNGMPVIYESKAYRTQVTTLTLGLKDNSVENLQQINSWLTGKGELIFSNDPDKHYIAVCNGTLTGTRMIRTLGKLPVQFTVLPFKYANSEDWQEIDVSSSHYAFIENHGTAESEPTFKLFGNGELSLYDYSTGTNVLVRNVSDHCIVDTPNRRVYDKDGNVILNETTGNVPGLRVQPGSTQYSFSENVSKIQVKVNTRWL